MPKLRPAANSQYPLSTASRRIQILSFILFSFYLNLLFSFGGTLPAFATVWIWLWLFAVVLLNYLSAFLKSVVVLAWATETNWSLAWSEIYQFCFTVLVLYFSIWCTSPSNDWQWAISFYSLAIIKNRAERARILVNWRAMLILYQQIIVKLFLGHFFEAAFLHHEVGSHFAGEQNVKILVEKLDVLGIIQLPEHQFRKLNIFESQKHFRLSFWLYLSHFDFDVCFIKEREIILLQFSLYFNVYQHTFTNFLVRWLICLMLRDMQLDLIRRLRILHCVQKEGQISVKNWTV